MQGKGAWSHDLWQSQSLKTVNRSNKNRKAQVVRREGKNAFIDLRSRDLRLAGFISADAF